MLSVIILRRIISAWQRDVRLTCPYVSRPFDDDWGLEDPTGKADEEFKSVIKNIESRILQMKGMCDEE